MSIEAEIPYIMQCVANKYDPLLHEIELRFNKWIASIEDRLPVSPEVVAELRRDLAEANAALERANKRDAERIVELERLKLLSRSHFTCDRCGFAWFSEPHKYKSRPERAVPVTPCMNCEVERLKAKGCGNERKV